LILVAAITFAACSPSNSEPGTGTGGSTGSGAGGKGGGAGGSTGNGGSTGSGGASGGTGTGGNSAGGSTGSGGGGVDANTSTCLANEPPPNTSCDLLKDTPFCYYGTTTCTCTGNDNGVGASWRCAGPADAAVDQALICPPNEPAQGSTCSVLVDMSFCQYTGGQMCVCNATAGTDGTWNCFGQGPPTDAGESDARDAGVDSRDAGVDRRG
jgi:hypothetical protein